MIRNILTPFKFFITTTFKGLYYICLILSRGFFLPLYLFSYFLNQISNNKVFNSFKNICKKIQESTLSFLVILLIFAITLLFLRYGIVEDKAVYVKNDNEEEHIEHDDVNLDIIADKTEINLYKKFSSYKESDINIMTLKEINPNIVAWLIVDGTNINYPIVKTDNNDYYLSHDIHNNYSIGGWTFMDFRNKIDMSDYNTIFYGHNLYNKTAFGSISNIFTDKWYNNSNHRIRVITENENYTYEIFSVYYSDPNNDYLTTGFLDGNAYLEFANQMKNKSKYNFNVELNQNDKMITLSTCTNDDKGRKVIHAKKVN